MLTDWIARIEGTSGSSIISLDFKAFGWAQLEFAAVGIPAAIVNSGLKFMQKQIELAFQSKLSEHLHSRYCRNRAYYAASNLGGMTSADQRITEDVDKFCFSISELYSHTFKPLLDVILFTRSLSKVMGYKGQFLLYGYYLVVAYILKIISPPLAHMSSQEAALVGTFRAAHQRLVTYSEEVAYNDPPGGMAEELVLNQHLKRLVKYSGLSALQRCVQQVADGYLVKYFASVTALLVYAAPIYFRDPSTRSSHGELAHDYIRSMRLLQNTNKGVGDLVLVYKRITNLAAHTGRVSELLEQVKQLSGGDVEHRELFRRNVSSTHILGIAPSTSKSTVTHSDDPEPSSPVPPQILHGDSIKCHRVSMGETQMILSLSPSNASYPSPSDSPDGAPLVRELTFEVTEGRSAMIMGPNGSGKSSLFRVMSGLWPLLSGVISVPEKQKGLFYLSQRPYLVSGTLRDQLLYPFPPQAVWEGTGSKARALFTSNSSTQPPTPGQELDERLGECLEAVELGYLLSRGSGWSQVQNWQETLSGGEKQRVAMARLLFHRPKFAVLDECTSAVSADGEVKLYQALERAGITFLSIAHRPALRSFHSFIIHFDGGVERNGLGWRLEELKPLTPTPHPNPRVDNDPRPPTPAKATMANMRHPELRPEAMGSLSRPVSSELFL